MWGWISSLVCSYLSNAFPILRRYGRTLEYSSSSVIVGGVQSQAARTGLLTRARSLRWVIEYLLSCFFNCVFSVISSVRLLSSSASVSAPSVELVFASPSPWLCIGLLVPCFATCVCCGSFARQLRLAEVNRPGNVCRLFLRIVNVEELLPVYCRGGTTSTSSAQFLAPIERRGLNESDTDVPQTLPAIQVWCGKDQAD